jgi:hypothetical protein
VTRIAYVARGDDARTLGLLPGSSESFAWAINNTDTIVGWNLTGESGFPYTAVIYPNGSTLPTDLNMLIDPLDGVRLARALDINEAGQILVEGYGAGTFHHYVLSPTPEPTAHLLLGLDQESDRKNDVLLMPAPARRAVPEEMPLGYTVSTYVARRARPASLNDANPGEARRIFWKGVK